VVFRGVLAPGAPDLGADEDLVAVRRSRQGKRFQNYRAKFTVLDIGTAPRAWLTDVLSADPLSANCPASWRRWVAGRHYEALISTRLEYRSPADQMPADQASRQILDRLHAHFAGRPTDFEHFAAHLWQMADGHVGAYEVTHATADGGPRRGRGVPHRPRYRSGHQYPNPSSARPCSPQGTSSAGTDDAAGHRPDKPPDSVI
jgi:hypothetical protein